jgi:UDP-glucose:(heptosyl)LPS alpha-1,3-glucosyltransferase
MQAPAPQIATVAASASQSRPCDVTIVANDIGNVGGMERVLSTLIAGLHELGHRVTVIARTYDAPSLANVTFHRVRGPRRPALLAYPCFLVMGSLAVWRHRRGVVQATGAIVANRVDVIAVHYCHQVGPAHPSRSNVLYRAHARLLISLNRLSERIWFRAHRSTTFVCVSEGVADEVRTHYPDLSARVMRIHNGVDPRAFAPGRRAAEAAEMRARLLIPPERLVALFVGGEWEGKGLAELLQALARSEQWELLVVGRGDVERYRALADSLGASDRVHWLGVTRDVHLLYALADAFVLPSEYETFSLVTFEAAASGLPILATPVSGVRELIRDGQNGYLISRDPETIAERLRWLADDADLRARLGAAAREASSQFTWEKMINGYHDLYERLAGADASQQAGSAGVSPGPRGSRARPR